VKVVTINIHLIVFPYSHYDSEEMKRTPSGISPVIAVSKTVPMPLYRQIYEGYRQSIVNGNLRAGQRVPSTRVLAGELGISRVPAMSAYAQLHAEGYLESRVGSGTVVSKSLPEVGASPQAQDNLTTLNPNRRKVSTRCGGLPSAEGFYRRRDVRPFSLSQIAFEHFPQQIWNRLVTRHGRSATARSFDYGDPMGLSCLREVLATYLRTARGMRCEAEQIVIVSGSQQGLEITTRVLLDPGDRVWMEDPGYSFARTVFAMSRCQVAPVPVDDEGLDVALGATSWREARAVLVTPSHQYPLGVTMSASRRLQLSDWAERHRSWIIEDDYDSEFRYEGMPITALQGLDHRSRVIYIGTFSKVLFPSLRLGYVVLPADLVERFIAVRFATDICPATFHQIVLADFIREGHFSRHIRRMRMIYGERRRVLIECIREELGEGPEVPGAATGLHLSVLLDGVNDRYIAARASRQNLNLTALSPFYLNKTPQQGFVLGFGSTPARVIPAAVHKLATLVKGNQRTF